MGYFKEKYDAIVIGGALAGMSCALTLASKGLDVLVLDSRYGEIFYVLLVNMDGNDI